MPRYNYFVCRRCNDRKVAAPSPSVPGAIASPKCPACQRFMEHYDSGDLPGDPRPVPPPGAPPTPNVGRLSTREVPVYGGDGPNPGHPHVTWALSRNAAQAAWTLQLFLGQQRGGNWDSVLTARFHQGLLTQRGGSEKDWLVSPPAQTGAPDVWMSLDTRRLPAGRVNRFANQGHRTFNFVVKLGNAQFGLIHLLAGHQSTVRKAAKSQVFGTGDPRDETFRTMSLLQAGLQRFSPQNVHEIVEAGNRKWLLSGRDCGFLVVREEGNDTYSVTTTYNRRVGGGGQTWFKR